MLAATLLAVISSLTLATAQSLASNAPGCATRCFTVKITEADTLAPGASTLNGYCQSSRFVSAYYTCLYDNCASSDIPLSAQLLQQVCADQGAAVVTTGIVGPASTGISLSSIPISSAASSAVGSASSGLSSISSSASSGISSVSSGISQTASSISSGASSVASGASSTASSVLSGASQSATSVLSSAASEASSATSAAGGILSSVQNGASSVLSVASGGVQSAVPSSPASGAGNLVAPVALVGATGLFFAIFA